MALHKEIEFEKDICAHLAANGWLYADGDATAYDRSRALFPADLRKLRKTVAARAGDGYTGEQTKALRG